MNRDRVLHRQPSQWTYSKSQDEWIAGGIEYRGSVFKRSFEHFEKTDPPRQFGHVANQPVTRRYPRSDVTIPEPKSRDTPVRAAKCFVGFRRKEIQIVAHVPSIADTLYLHRSKNSC